MPTARFAFFFMYSQIPPKKLSTPDTAPTTLPIMALVLTRRLLLKPAVELRPVGNVGNVGPAGGGVYAGKVGAE